MSMGMAAFERECRGLIGGLPAAPVTSFCSQRSLSRGRERLGDRPMGRPVIQWPTKALWLAATKSTRRARGFLLTARKTVRGAVQRYLG